MNDKTSMSTNKKIIFIVLILLLIVAVISVGTYAWLTWKSTENTSLKLTIGDILDVSVSGGNDINIMDIGPVFNYEDGSHTGLTVTNKKDKLVNFSIKLDITNITDNLINETFKYKVLKVDGSTKTEVSEGDFSTSSTASTLILLNNIPITIGDTSFDIIFYIDGNMENDTSMMNGSLSGTILVDATEISYGTATETISNIYSSTSKTTVINNEITYNYAVNSALMNDRLGGTTDNLDGGNIRYYGANPNNYIYFNCSDYSNQNDTTCEKWRIIGVFDGNVKIIRNESIGNFSWDYDYNDGNSERTYSNDWNTSSLQALLNNQYYNANSTVYYNGTTTGVEVDFTNIGLNESTRNMINNSTWYLGNFSLAETNFYSNNFYNYERSSNKCSSCTYNTTWVGKIGLMYPSDYGYAADFRYCTSSLLGNNNSSCYENDWLFYKWTYLITPSQYNNSAIFVINQGGAISSLSNINSPANSSYPTLFLNSTINIIAGDGTESNPFKLSA